MAGPRLYRWFSPLATAPMPLAEAAIGTPPIAIWSRRRRVQLRLLSFALCALLLALPLKFSARLNDALAGPPPYMRALAGEFAHDLVQEGYGDAPIFLVRDEAQHCRALPTIRDFNPNAIAYVITYSESGHSFCLATYAGLASHAQDPVAVTLDPSALGQNYGAPLPGRVKAVLVARTLKAFPDSFISLLSWRTPWPKGNGLLPTESHVEASSSVPLPEQNFTMNLFAVRAEVARRHDQINRAFFWTLCLLAGTVLLSAARAGSVYLDLRRYCRVCGVDLALAAFLRRGVEPAARAAQASYRAAQEELQAQQRARDLERREEEEARGRLRFLLDNTADERARAAIRESLERGDVAAMNALAAALQAERGLKTPQERLDTLLESLHEFCGPREFLAAREQALQLLGQAGFRKARDFVVHTHEELRARARKLQEEAEKNGDKSAGAAVE